VVGLCIRSFSPRYSFLIFCPFFVFWNGGKFLGGGKNLPSTQANGPSAGSGQARQTAVQVFFQAQAVRLSQCIVYFSVYRAAKPQADGGQYS